MGETLCHRQPFDPLLQQVGNKVHGLNKNGRNGIHGSGRISFFFNPVSEINNDTSMRVVHFCTVAFRQTMRVVFTNTVAFSFQIQSSAVSVLILTDAHTP